MKCFIYWTADLKSSCVHNCDDHGLLEGEYCIMKSLRTMSYSWVRPTLIHFGPLSLGRPCPGSISPTMERASSVQHKKGLLQNCPWLVEFSGSVSSEQSMRYICWLGDPSFYVSQVVSALTFANILHRKSFLHCPPSPHYDITPFKSWSLRQGWMIDFSGWKLLKCNSHTGAPGCSIE